MVNLERESRGQQLNNSVKSVSPSPSKSKASDQRKTRQDSYREKFGNRPHMIIPQEDSEFIETQSLSVNRLWHQCWRSDPYGNRWMTLNHNLSSGSFKRAKKILADKGLFVFEPKKSMLDGRETAYWLVKNLHGARRNDFWFNIDRQVNLNDHAGNLEDQICDLEDQICDLEDHRCDLEDHGRSSISIETQTQQGLQNPSGGISGSSSETPQGVSKELGIESEAGDRHRQPAFDERVGLAPPQDEQKKAVTSSLDKKSQIKRSRENPDPIKDSPALTKKSTQELLEETVPYNPWSAEAIKSTNAINLRIEAEQKTEEYQHTSKEALARIRANLAKQQERMDAERRAKDWEVSPMSLMDSQNVEELKREKEAERWQEEALEESPPESLRNDRVINRPAPEDYQDDW